MRHGRKVKKLGRYKQHRVAMLRNLIMGLVKNERIITTVERAKVLRKYIEKLITRAKKDQSVHSKRIVARWIPNRKLLVKLFENIAPRYINRPGGYTRIVKLQKYRAGDGGELALIEFVEEALPEKTGGEKK